MKPFNSAVKITPPASVVGDIGKKRKRRGKKGKKEGRKLLLQSPTTELTFYQTFYWTERRDKRQQASYPDILELQIFPHYKLKQRGGRGKKTARNNNLELHKYITYRPIAQFTTQKNH